MDIYRNQTGQPHQVAPNGQGSDRMLGLTLGAGAVCVGMVAGMFFDWATSIMPSLAEADDRTYAIVMQKTITTINSSPLFLLSLMGAFIFTGVAAIIQNRLGAKAAFRWTLAGLALYVVAVLITMGVHFPLNDTLENAGNPDSIDLAALRAETEDSWANAHLARTGAAVLSLAFLCRALWLRRR